MFPVIINSVDFNTLALTIIVTGLGAEAFIVACANPRNLS